MPNLNIKFKKLLKQLEDNIKNQEDLETVKVELFDLYNSFFEELSKVEETSTIRIAELAEAQATVEDKLKKLQKDVKEIQKDIYEDETEDSFSISCPYCNNEITIEAEDLPDEVKCPECKNTVELDWNCGCDEEHDTGCCDNNCTGCNSNNEDDM